MSIELRTKKQKVKKKGREESHRILIVVSLSFNRKKLKKRHERNQI